MPISKKRTVCVVPIDLSNRKITPHREPKSFSGTSTYEYDASDAFQILMCWNLLRQAYSTTSQVISRFVGWISLIFGKVNLGKHKNNILAFNSQSNNGLQYSARMNIPVTEVGRDIEYDVHTHYS